jgi:hypothetical protein
MPRFIITIENSAVTAIAEAGASEDEDLGLEWALSELRDSHRHNGRFDGEYSVTNESERDAFLKAVEALAGRAALGRFTPAS